MAGSARTYGGATHSERRSRRQALLIDAALDLIADGGVGSLTVRGVCSQARLNDRYFYESFRSVDELLLALLDDQITRAFDALLPAIEASPPDPMLRARAAIGTGLGFLGEDSRRARLLIESQATEVLRTRRRDLIKMLAQVMADQGRVLLAGQDALDPDIDLAALTLVAGGFEVVTQWLRGELDVTREHLEDFLVAMVTAR
ncbi:TetR/AcrR family transcriptional regulator [Mycobacterium xenopi]|uniref:Bacterial regulatory s, tetR family protein n=1 Tax=Mycobacterium xenopi 4042 TaxID=1299334 RepID=X7Z5K3_MYCXE|nr:TetR/AcrR family transcriptional regulator [Mycobacterium xenopi]EUA14073.1 bacterial regulatory s, tetR family protein [Mycobacterium xenopi 4042]MDA3639241.1 TetR/AcrR family transcriptional regulator [Mycobacterium xenopi]MDA3657613.1 TetR/AcrR family transcriptional regulator [Mycobacterium xenopi]MDA3661637.1 TetR/AcrR family transcriptional regulator [Mycobacterium xenopi]